ncbi:MAG: pentapeptide repeat-containing protein, partial [Acidobacteriota bacterium]
VDPVIDTAAVAIFVFKERLGRITQQELERCRIPSAHQPPVYAVFPKNPPASEKMGDAQTVQEWLEVLAYRKKLTEDWAEPTSRSIRPLELYADHEDLREIVLQQFQRDLKGILLRRLASLSATFRDRSHEGFGPQEVGRAHPRDDFLARVETVLRLKNGDRAAIKRLRTGGGKAYLRVTEDEGGIHRVYPVSAVQGNPTNEAFDAHLKLHQDYRSADPGVISMLIYGGSPAGEPLRRRASLERVRLHSFVECQGLIDFRPYVDRQTRRLENDATYPPSLYVPQRLRRGEHEMRALPQVEEWLRDVNGRFVLILGDFGTGKTFLLHELARRLGVEQGPLTPILIEMRDLEKGRSLGELVAQHLTRSGVERFDLKAFRYMLKEGRIALLFDGFDELALRVSYERAGDHFATLVEAAGGDAKVVVTSRTTHFESEAQVKTALGEKVDLLPGRRVAHLQPFDETQIRDFLVNHLESEEAADARFAVIDEVKDLLGLSHNPRMLSFIADLREEDLLAAKGKDGEITSAELYRLILERWLIFEYNRHQPKGAPKALEVEERWDAVTQLALRLWQRTERSLTVGEMSDELAAALTNLAEGLTHSVATHQVGSGTLLIRDAEGAFSFIHQSVLEWLVARRVADDLVGAGASEALTVRELSTLMADFVIGLAGAELVAMWAQAETSRGVSEIGKKNALLVLRRLGQDEDADTASLPAETSDLSGQNLQGADLSGMQLSAAVMSHSDLTAAKLVGTDLRFAQLEGTVLRDADLSRARLGGADLKGADLTGASLLGAQLEGAHLKGATLRRTALVGARVDGGLVVPEDSAPAVPAKIEPWVASASPCNAVAWAASGDLLATGHDDGIVRVWDLEAGQEIRRLVGHESFVLSVAFSPDGETLASGSNDQTVRLWDVSGGEERLALSGHESFVWSVAFSP